MTTKLRILDGHKTPQAKADLSVIDGPLANKGFQAGWLKDPNGYTQGVRWDMTTCGGCYRSPGCQLCPSYIDALRAKEAGEVVGKVSYRLENLYKPLRWRKRKNAFVSPEGDLFHDNIPDDHILEIFNVMMKCPQHNFIMTTKREHRLDILSDQKHSNVHVGVSIESQEFMYRADALIELPDNLHKILFLAPMLTDMVIPQRVLKKVSWIICSPERGGKGRKPRPCNEEWLIDLIQQVRSYDLNLPIFLDMPYQEKRVYRIGRPMEVPATLMD